jgi:hypothetical protein
LYHAASFVLNGRNAHFYADKANIHPHIHLLRLEPAVDVDMDISVNWMQYSSDTCVLEESAERQQEEIMKSEASVQKRRTIAG